MATKTFKIGLSNTDKQNMAQDVYERLLALTFPEYDSAESYDVGDFVVYNDQLYKCIGATTGAWDSTKWQLATLNDLVTDIENAVAFVNDKANVDGNYPTMTVGVADNLSPYDEESGINQHAPFSFQASGTNNGDDPTATVGALAIMSEKRGNTVVVNQFAKELNATNYPLSSVYEGKTSFSNGVVTFAEVPANSSYARLFNKQSFVSGHKVLVHFYATVSEGSIRVGLFADGGYSGDNSVVVSVASNPNQYFIVQVNQEDEVAIMTATNSQTSGLVKDLIAVDLTQWFNGDIPEDLLDNPENFFRYYQGSLAYNAGTLVNANSRYLKAIGRNQWDEEIEGNYIDPDTGANTPQDNSFRSKNYVKVISNGNYHFRRSSVVIGTAKIYEYDKDKNFIKSFTVVGSDAQTNTFDVSPNTCYIRFAIYLADSGWGANPPSKETAQITISIYYEGEGGYDKYYPYELLTNNDTGSEELLAFDYKTPDGVVHKNTGSVDLGSLTYTQGNRNDDDTGYIFYATKPENMKQYSEAKCSNLVCKNEDVLWETLKVGECLTSVTDIVICLDENSAADAKSALNGVYLFYELATPTTEQGTPFSENIAIDDFGTMDFSGASGVPQGNALFYPVDYKAYLDTLHNYTDGDPANLALNSELNVKFESYLKSISGYDATATQVLKNVEGTLTWVTEE